MTTKYSSNYKSPKSNSTAPASTPPSSSIYSSASDTNDPTMTAAAASMMTLEQMQELEQRDATAKTALAKSDAIILELRSNVRMLKRQCEHLEAEKQLLQQAQSSKDSQARQVMINQQSHSSVIGELQVQLDRAHAQILTADMVRKELEDTLEAEQYTWELRVQDQERQLLQMMDECATLRDDLDKCRSQWNEAEIGWTNEVKELKTALEAAHRDLNKANKQNDFTEMSVKLEILENERTELQGCLDEAMQELEAVDQELRASPDVEGRLCDLYKWFLEQHGEASHEDIPTDVEELMQGIQEMAQHTVAIGRQIDSDDAMEIHELQAQISVYRGDLKAREESSKELRSSLKEAVALLKPLQDAVHKTDLEKQALEKELTALRGGKALSDDSVIKEQIIEDLQSQVQALQQQLSTVIPERVSKAQTVDGGESSSAAKKRLQEEALQKLLLSTQSRFQELNQTNTKVMAENVALQEQLQNDEIMLRLEDDLKVCEDELKRKDEEILALRDELNRQPHSHGLEPVEHEKKSDALEADLEQTRQELIEKTEVERILNKSLKEALSLLKPLQMHLETSEREKRDLSKQLKLYKKRSSKYANGSPINDSMALERTMSTDLPHDEREDLEQRLQQLELQTSGADKLKEDFVELNARYQVTHSKLELVTKEQHTLVDALKQYQYIETDLLNELKEMTDKLAKTEHELENAKYIATSALMKVEEMTMENVQKMSIENNSGLQEKVQLLEREVESAKELNETLETSIQERDSILQALAEQHDASKDFDDFSSSTNIRAKQGNSSKGVTWDKNWE